MIILDTNTISEMMKPLPSTKIMTWFDQQEVIHLFVTTITVAEISYGLNILSKGDRRNELEEAFNKAITEAFKYRILSFDESAAHLYGKIMAERKKLGRPMSVPNGQICAIARAHGAVIATRNICDFAASDIDLINPFE